MYVSTGSTLVTLSKKFDTLQLSLKQLGYVGNVKVE